MIPSNIELNLISPCLFFPQKKISSKIACLKSVPSKLILDKLLIINFVPNKNTPSKFAFDKLAPEKFTFFKLLRSSSESEKAIELIKELL